MIKYFRIIPIIIIIFTHFSCIDFWSPAKFNDGTMMHAASGNFIYKSGGHLQKNISLLDKLGIRYEITKTYDNGVRVGKIKTADDIENNQYYYKENHSWFPKNWNTLTLRSAVRHIVNEPSNKALINRNILGESVRLIGEYKNVRMIVIVRMKPSTDGRQAKNVVITAYPDSQSQPSAE